MSLQVIPVTPIVGMLGEGRYVPLIIVRPAKSPGIPLLRIMYIGGHEKPKERYNQAREWSLQVFKEWSADGSICVDAMQLGMSLGQYKTFDKFFNSHTTDLANFNTENFAWRNEDAPRAPIGNLQAVVPVDPLQYAIDAYPAYWRPLPDNWNAIDTYRIDSLFPLNDSRLTHARKKLLVPGVRTGGKSMRKDIKEAYETVGQWLKDNPDE